jgi:preprotein translocase subunit Sec61beta
MLNESRIDPDRVVFFGCMFGALVLMIVNVMH